MQFHVVFIAMNGPKKKLWWHPHKGYKDNFNLKRYEKNMGCGNSMYGKVHPDEIPWDVVYVTNLTMYGGSIMFVGN